MLTNPTHKSKSTVGTSTHQHTSHLKLWLLSIYILFSSQFVNAGTDFRSVASGNWNSNSTWEMLSGGAWIPATSTPTSTSTAITILSSHVVTITANVSIDNVIINNNGEVDLNSGVTITIKAGTGIDFDVYGNFKNSGTVNFNAGATMVFENGGGYQHNFTTVGGTVPTATWNTGSTCEIIGYTTYTGNPAGLAQNFYNFTWNCPSQSAGISLGGSLTTVNGNLSIINTGTGDFEFAKTVVANVTVYGSFVQTGGIFILNYTSSTSVLNLKGAFSMIGGSLQRGGGLGSINFTGTTPQVFSKTGGTISGGIDFTISSGADVNFGTSILDGSSGIFTLASGGAINIGSTSGISTSGATGNIQVTGTRTFNTTADYNYNGVAAQITGNGLPTTVRNLTTNNSSGLTLTNDVNVTGTLNITSGIITTGAKKVILGSSAASTGNLVRTAGYIKGTLKRWIAAAAVSNILFPVGTATDYKPLNYSYTTAPGTGGSITVYFDNTYTGSRSINILDAGDTLQNVGLGLWNTSAADGLTGGVFSLDMTATNLPGVSTYTSLHLIERINSISPWTNLGLHVTTTGSNSVPVLHRTGMFSHMQFGVGSPAANPLPIELIYFNAKYLNDLVDFSWATATETNNDFFTIERSTDGINFQPILFQSGAGNSTSTLYYTNKDKNPSEGINYYRLKQTDFDGHTGYSDVKVVTVNQKIKKEEAIALENVSPNPFNNELKIQFSTIKSGIAEIKIVGVDSKVVYSSKVIVESGTNTISINEVEQIKTGIYFLIIIFNNENISSKIIKY